MEETEVVQAAPAVTEIGKTAAWWGVMKRLLMGLGFTLLGGVTAISGAVISLVTVFLVPAFLTLAVTQPVLAVGMFAYYLVSAVVFWLVAGISFNFVYKILRKKTIERRLKVIFAMSLVLAIVSWVLMGPLKVVIDGFTG